MENILVRSYLPSQRTTALPQFRWYLGSTTDHSQRPSSRPSQSTATARTRGGKNQSATITQKHTKQSRWFLEELDEVFRPKLVTKKQVVSRARQHSDWWSCIGARSQTQKMWMENGAYYRHLSWKRQPCTKSENQNNRRRVRQTYSQTVFDCNKGRAWCRTTLVYINSRTMNTCMNLSILNDNSLLN